MYKALVVLALLGLTACGEEYKMRDAEQTKMNLEIKQKGFIEVGKMPDGRPLLMTQIDRGFNHDRVYFAGDAITAVENCGKSCERSVTMKAK